MPRWKCAQCGAVPDLEAVQRGECAYCHAALPHAVTAAGEALAAERLLRDSDGDGVPDALETLQRAQQQQERRAEVEEEVARLRRQIETAENVKSPPVSRSLASGLSWAVVGGLGWGFVTTAGAETDPWLGGHAAVFCPVTCEGCEGPYVFHRTRGAAPDDPWHGPFRIYCQHPESTVGSGWTTMMDDLEVNARYEVDFGWTGMLLCSIAAWFLPGVCLAVVIARRYVSATKRGLVDLREELADAEAELRELS